MTGKKRMNEKKRREAYTEAHKRAQNKYNAENILQVSLKLNRRTEADIIAKLENVDNKQGYIKRLIRDDLNE